MEHQVLITDDGSELINLNDFEREAKAKLDPSVFGYYSTGSCDEVTLDENVSAYRKIKLYPRIMRGISSLSLKTTLLGHEFKLPFGFSPTAYQGLAHIEGDLATTRAATSLGTLHVPSQESSWTLEDIAEESGGVRFFQCEFLKDREEMLKLIRRAEAAGYSALVVTCDIPIESKRERSMRNPMEYKIPPNYISLCEKCGEENFDDQFERNLNWYLVKWLKTETKLPIIVKGVAHPQDAHDAIAAGVEGIFVSNHGGRQLDSTPASIDLLPEIAKVCKGRCPVIFDGGIRRGGDILKALALGADFVMIGRPVLWGLACGGQHGVEIMVKILTEELKTDMILTGCSRIGEIGPGIIFPSK